MYWIDGSIYKGMWVHGIQHGLGLMVFPEGLKKAGIFEQNTYKANIESFEDLN